MVILVKLYFTDLISVALIIPNLQLTTVPNTSKRRAFTFNILLVLHKYDNQQHYFYSNNFYPFLNT